LRWFYDACVLSRGSRDYRDLPKFNYLRGFRRRRRVVKRIGQKVHGIPTTAGARVQSNYLPMPSEKLTPCQILRLRCSGYDA
jgi:hypothetical protein